MNETDNGGGEIVGNATDTAKRTPEETVQMILTEHPEWAGMMDKEIVFAVEAGTVDVDEAILYMGARKVRKYKGRNVA